MAHGGDARQELRIALVMNGGVSLAVWMGGVTRELDRVRRGDGLYMGLLDLVNADARIDVIAGASAGGINGAALALAIARGGDVSVMQELWMDRGSIADLLRDPEKDDAPSLLRGDEKLLDGLRAAMAEIAKQAKGQPADTPLRLAVTGTPLEGQVTRYPDRFGATIADVDHRALFHFRDDAFGDVRAPDRLALAARSSASFPGAFEPSWVPVGSQDEDDTHPDMDGIASFHGSRWLIDGGVLDNTPFRPALDEIRGLGARAPVRRVLGYVVPALASPEPHGAHREKRPGVPEVVIDAMSRLPRVQSIGRELEEIEENNRSVRHRRDARRHTLTNAGDGELERMAEAMLPAYVETRREAAVYDLVGDLLAGTAAGATPNAATVAEVRDVLARAPDAPWLPPPGGLTVDPWRWGFAPVEHAGNVALDLLQRLVALQRIEPEIQEQAMGLRGMLHAFLEDLAKRDRESKRHWAGAAEEIFANPGAATGLMSAWQDEFARRLGGIATGIAGTIAYAAALVAQTDATGKYADEARELAQSLVNLGEPFDATLTRLLALDVVQRAAGADLTGLDQPVELALISADSACSFGEPKTAQGKLAGLQLGHFGGFYKRSWRANDWMWGRLDGADRVVRMILDPRRVQRRLRAGELAEKLADEIRMVACDAEDPTVAALLADAWPGDAVLDELDRLADPDYEDPSATDLKSAYEAIRRRAQLEILMAEIPEVVKAVHADLDAGTSKEAAGVGWAKTLELPLDPQATIDAFVACPVAGETIKQEEQSKYFAHVASTALADAASVAVEAVPAHGLTVIPNWILRTVRWLTLRVYRRND